MSVARDGHLSWADDLNNVVVWKIPRMLTFADIARPTTKLMATPDAREPTPKLSRKQRKELRRRRKNFKPWSRPNV